MVTRTLEALLPQERIFILPRRVTIRYPGSTSSLTETVLQVRICKNYTHQPPQLPVFANSIVRTSQARLRLGLTQDRPSRLLVTGGYTFELLHPDGTSFPSPRTPLPHYSLRFAQPFIVLAGIAPGYTPDQILAALYQHDQLAIQTAQTEGHRPPIPIAEHIHLVVCGPGSLDPRPLNAGQPTALIAGSSSLTLVYKFPNSPQHLQSSHLVQATDDQPSPSVKTATTPAHSVRLQHATPPPKTNTFCVPTHTQRPL